MRCQGPSEHVPRHELQTVSDDKASDRYCKYKLTHVCRDPISISHITTFHLGLYVPTYIDLAFQHALPEGDRPYRPIKNARLVDFTKLRSGPAKSKGKGKKTTKADEDGTTVYQEEKEFLIEMLCESPVQRHSRSVNVAQGPPP
jgi:hypothetical protein